VVLVKKSYKTGISFGLVSGVLTTLGLLIGLGVGTQSKEVIIGGILTIAVADALSDAFGVHLSQESTGENSKKQIWESTISTFLSKFLLALTFLIPVLIFDIKTARIIDIVWGFVVITLISLLSSILNRVEKKELISAVLEHVLLFIFTVTLSYLIGTFIDKKF
jgi:VIT1/CCC1 family predicted Fe2+/Mn2+ transporter